MKNLLFCIVLLCTIQSYGQRFQSTAVVLGNEVIEKTDGVVIDAADSDDKTFWFVTVQLGGYYDFTLLQLAVTAVVDKYSDVYVYAPWVWNDNKASYTKSYLSGKSSKLTVFLYFPETKKLGILCEY